MKDNELQNERRNMIITITATEKLTDINGVPVRLWEGVTDQGTKCKVFVHRLVVHKDEDQKAFEEEFTEQMPPNDSKIDLRQIL